MASYRVVVHGIPSRALAQAMALHLAGQTVIEALDDTPDAAIARGLAFSVEPDDEATAEVDPAIEPVRGTVTIETMTSGRLD